MIKNYQSYFEIQGVYTYVTLQRVEYRKKVNKG